MKERKRKLYYETIYIQGEGEGIKAMWIYTTGKERDKSKVDIYKRSRERERGEKGEHRVMHHPDAVVVADVAVAAAATAAALLELAATAAVLLAAVVVDVATLAVGMLVALEAPTFVGPWHEGDLSAMVVVAAAAVAIHEKGLSDVGVEQPGDVASWKIGGVVF